MSDYLDLLGLPPSDWTRHLITAGTELDDWLPRVDDNDVGTRLMAWVTHAFMEGVVLVEREGKEAKFRIPPALTKTVRG